MKHARMVYEKAKDGKSVKPPLEATVPEIAVPHWERAGWRRVQEAKSKPTTSAQDDVSTTT